MSIPAPRSAAARGWAGGGGGGGGLKRPSCSMHSQIYKLIPDACVAMHQKELDQQIGRAWNLRRRWGDSGDRGGLMGVYRVVLWCGINRTIKSSIFIFISSSVAQMHAFLLVIGADGWLTDFDPLWFGSWWRQKAAGTTDQYPAARGGFLAISTADQRLGRLGSPLNLTHRGLF